MSGFWDHVVDAAADLRREPLAACQADEEVAFAPEHQHRPRVAAEVGEDGIECREGGLVVASRHGHRQPPDGGLGFRPGERSVIRSDDVICEAAEASSAHQLADRHVLRLLDELAEADPGLA